jgi:hypothetical protein
LKEGEIINENKTLLPIPGSHVVAAGVGGKEIELCKDLERELEYTKRSKLWMIWSL